MCGAFREQAAREAPDCRGLSACGGPRVPRPVTHALSLSNATAGTPGGVALGTSPTPWSSDRPQKKDVNIVID